MRSSTFLALAASLYTPSVAVYQGFNYGATQEDGTVKVQSDYEAEFQAAKELTGNSGFTSARLYTTIQSGGGPIEAIPAAIAQDTSLLLGIWVSGGQASVTEEIDALTSAISTYGTSFTDLVVGLSVGSEDLYRNSPTGIAADAGVGANPDDIVSYISQVKSAIAGTALADVSIGHVDTWTAWVNGSNSAVVDACDWIGMDAYPFFQNTEANGIENGKGLFTDAYDATQAVSSGKPVWITETGWPVSGDAEGDGVASLANAKTYYDAVGCGFAFGNINTWWYTLQDAYPTTPNPSFGVVGTTLSSTPLYDLSCSNVTSTSSNSSATGSGTVATAAASNIASAGGAISPSQGSGSGVAAASGSAATTLASVAAGSTGTSGSGSGSSNGTYTAPSKSATGTSGASSASASSTGAVSSTGGASALSVSVVGIFGGLLAMMVAL